MRLLSLEGVFMEQEGRIIGCLKTDASKADASKPDASKPDASKPEKSYFSIILKFKEVNGKTYSSVPHIRNNIFFLRSDMFLIK